MKLTHPLTPHKFSDVAPYAGAWIETVWAQS